MRQIQQIVYILLYLQFFVCNVLTINIDILEENTGTNVKYINEWKCNSTDDCTAVNSVCSEGFCQCNSGFIFNSDKTACVKVATRLYDLCVDTVQCSTYLLTGAKCVENVCVCGPGYYYLHGRCNRHFGLFEKCKRNSDCYVNADFEASTCDAVEGICKCSPGFYQREYRTCRREGKAAGDECTVDIDCTFDNATCSEFVCAAKSKADKTVELLSGVVLTAGIADKILLGTRVGSKCTTNEDCKEVENAICGPTGTCRCDRAHFASDTDTECIPELGEPCQNDDVNHIEKSICREGRWSCTKGTVASGDNRECLNVTTEYMGKCQLKEQCYIFGPDAVCNNNTCVCNGNLSRYMESELFCWRNKGLNETCRQDRDCFVKDFKGNLTCNGTCGCPDGTRLSKDNSTCIGPTEIGGFCEKRSDCAPPNSLCKKQVCTCVKNYYESHNHCLPGIGADCTSDEGCAPEDSICISKKCVCKPDYVSASIDSCMPVLLFGEPCLLDVQCSAVTIGAICAIPGKKRNNTETTTVAESKVCTCSEEDYYKFGRCFKRRFLSETCTNLGECYESYENQERIVCRNGKCACIWGYVQSNSSVCMKHSQMSKFFLNGGATNIVSLGFLSLVSLTLSSKLF